MPGKNPLETAKAEIRGLNRKVIELEGKLLEAARKPEAETDKLSRSSFEAYVGLAIGIVLAVWPMTWWLRIPLFLILVAVSADFCWRSPLTYKWPPKAKGILGTIFLAWIGWAAYGNIQKSYTNEEFPPDVPYMLRWGASQTTPHKSPSLIKMDREEGSMVRQQVK